MKLNNTHMKATLLCLGLSAVFFAQASDNPPHRHMNPPQEAFDACNDKTEGDSCDVITSREETLTGTCRIPPRQNQLLCIPDNHKRPSDK